MDFAPTTQLSRSSRASALSALHIVLIVACALLVLWAASAAVGRSCRHGGGTAPFHGGACPSLAEDLAPLAVALGLAMIAWRLRHLPQPSPFLTFIGFSIAVASGKLGLLGSDVGMRLYFISLAGAAPAFFLLHHRLLGEPLGRRSRRVLAALLGLALGLALPPALASFAVLAEQPWYSLWRGMVRLSAALSVLVSGAWLVFSWRRDWPEVKLRPLRLVTYGNIVAFAPLVLLSMLPDTFHSPVYVPYEITLFGSLLSPLCYSHAFTMTGAPGHGVRLRFLSVYLMLAVLLTFVLLVAMAAFTVAGLPVGQAWAIALLVASAAIVAVGPSTRRWFTGLSEWTWFGRGPGYDQILDRLSETLSTTLDQERLRRMLVSELVRELGLSGAALFLKDSTGHLRLVEAVGSMHLENADLAVPVDGPLVEHLSTHPRPVTQDGLRQALASHSLGMAERFLLAMEPPLWVPLVSGGEAYGLLLVGPKTDADFFTPDDVRLLTLLGYRAGVAAHNVLLMKELRRSHEQLSRAHQRLLDAVEQERRRLAHELHDGAVQQLLAVTYHVAHYRHTLADDGGEQSSAVQAASEALDSLRQELLAVVTQLRSSISGLRPAGLDDLGLAAALAGYVSRLEQEHLGRMPEIELDLDEGSARLPSRVSLCLFRVAQEALRNAIRHSRADFVRVRLRVEAERVHLLVSDDGQGFVVPERLSQLTGEGHFGLLSISERVSLLPGKLTIRSRPDYGTEISVDVDLSEVDPSD